MRADDAAAWGRLREAGLVTGEPPVPEQPDTPWYVRAILGVSGWIAAGFLLLFFGAFLADLLDSAPACLALGLAVTGTACAVLARLAHNDFGAQLGLATSFAGQALVWGGLVQLIEADRPQLWLSVACFEALLAVAVPLPIHRVWSAFATAAATWLALRSAGASVVGTGLLAAGVAALWLAELARPRQRSLVVPGAYGVTLALLFVDAVAIVQRMAFELVGERLDPGAHHVRLGEAITGLILLGVVRALARRGGMPITSRHGAAALLATALVALASLRAPGIATGLMLVLLGFGNGNQRLLGMGILALLGAVAAFYYALDATLVAKSAVLAATGAVLLGARLALRHVWPVEQTHA